MQQTREDSGRHSRSKRECLASVRWVTANLAYLQPQENSGWQGFLERVRALTELALVYAYLHRWQSAALGDFLPLDRYLARWRRTILQTCDSDTYTWAVRGNPGDGLHLMQLYMWMRSAGCRSTRNEETMAYLKRLDRRPETIGQVHSMWKAGYVRDDPGWAELCQKKVSSLSEFTASIPIGEAYELTHTVFYATDFGDQPLLLESQEREQAVRTTERLLSYWSSAGEWDIASELLASLNCLDADDTAAARALARARLDNGGIPVNRAVLRTDQVLHHDETFWLCYHTTLIDALRCAIAINTLIAKRDKDTMMQVKPRRPLVIDV